MNDDTNSRELLEALVDAIGEALGVDTGTCNTSMFEAAVEAADALLANYSIEGPFNPSNYATLTLNRLGQDITVELLNDGTQWYITRALDEVGHENGPERTEFPKLTAAECTELLARAAAGEDDTGR